MQAKSDDGNLTLAHDSPEPIRKLWVFFVLLTVVSGLSLGQWFCEYVIHYRILKTAPPSTYRESAYLLSLLRVVIEMVAISLLALPRPHRFVAMLPRQLQRILAASLFLGWVGDLLLLFWGLNDVAIDTVYLIINWLTFAAMAVGTVALIVAATRFAQLLRAPQIEGWSRLTLIATIAYFAYETTARVDIQFRLNEMEWLSSIRMPLLHLMRFLSNTLMIYLVAFFVLCLWFAIYLSFRRESAN